MSVRHSTKPPCTFAGCGRRSHSNGLCLAHYKQVWKGKPLTALNVSKRIERNCSVCAKQFITLPSRIRTGRGVFCSKSCAYENLRVPLAERFWKYVNKTESCWLWTGSHGNYGFITMTERRGEPQQLLAHRASWELHFGTIPDGLWVLHNCPDGDNPLCVNPAHLWLGTAADNSRDMVAKGRNVGNRGEDNGSAKMTWETVRAMRARHAQGDISFASLGAEFGVHTMTAHSIIRGETWKE